MSQVGSVVLRAAPRAIERERDLRSQPACDLEFSEILVEAWDETRENQEAHDRELAPAALQVSRLRAPAERVEQARTADEVAEDCCASVVPSQSGSGRSALVKSLSGPRSEVEALVPTAPPPFVVAHPAFEESGAHATRAAQGQAIEPDARAGGGRTERAPWTRDGETEATSPGNESGTERRDRTPTVGLREPVTVGGMRGPFVPAEAASPAEATRADAAVAPRSERTHPSSLSVSATGAWAPPKSDADASAGRDGPPTGRSTRTHLDRQVPGETSPRDGDERDAATEVPTKSPGPLDPVMGRRSSPQGRLARAYAPSAATAGTGAPLPSRSGAEGAPARRDETVAPSASGIALGPRATRAGEAAFERMPALGEGDGVQASSHVLPPSAGGRSARESAPVAEPWRTIPAGSTGSERSDRTGAHEGKGVAGGRVAEERSDVGAREQTVVWTRAPHGRGGQGEADLEEKTRAEGAVRRTEHGVAGAHIGGPPKAVEGKARGEVARGEPWVEEEASWQASSRVRGLMESERSKDISSRVDVRSLATEESGPAVVRGHNGGRARDGQTGGGETGGEARGARGPEGGWVQVHWKTGGAGRLEALIDAKSKGTGDRLRFRVEEERGIRRLVLLSSSGGRAAEDADLVRELLLMARRSDSGIDEVVFEREESPSGRERTKEEGDSAEGSEDEESPKEGRSRSLEERTGAQADGGRLSMLV
jgi:hypothetical protein